MSKVGAANALMDLMKKIFTSLCLVVACGSTMAVPIPGLFNTGVDGAGTVLAGGSDDPHYTINELSDAAAKVMTNPHGSWIANDTNSKWIWANADGQPVNVTYTFATTFDLTGLIAVRATFMKGGIVLVFQ